MIATSSITVSSPAAAAAPSAPAQRQTCPPRRQKADATRRKIVAAAHEEFAANGYQGATIASIARRAKVAAQTVYFVFHTKAALISAVIETAVIGAAPSFARASAISGSCGPPR